MKNFKLGIDTKCNSVDYGASWKMHSGLLSRSVVSHSLQHLGLQHTRLPCSSLSPGVCLNLCPLSHWGHPTISSFVAPFSSCPQSFPASGSFSVCWLFTSGGQSIGASASASVLPVNIQGSDGQWVHEKMLNILFITEMQIKTIMHYHLTWVRMAIIRKSTNNKCWRWSGEKETLLHYW